MPGSEPTINNFNKSWDPGANPFKLQESEIHLWRADIQVIDSLEKKYFELLSVDEKERAGRFRFKKDRVNYVAAKGILRTLLGFYLSTSAKELKFTYSPFEKPSIEHSLLNFNISHAGGKALFAFTLKDDIGVDLEEIRPIEVAQIAPRFFSKNEAAYIFSKPEKDQLDLFYRCWTRKEAFIKAHGEGLNLPLDKFEVSLNDEQESLRIKAIKWNPAAIKNWHLYSTRPYSNFWGAIVNKSKVKSIVKFNWEH